MTSGVLVELGVGCRKAHDFSCALGLGVGCRKAHDLWCALGVGGEVQARSVLVPLSMLQLCVPLHACPLTGLTLFQRFAHTFPSPPSPAHLEGLSPPFP